MMKQPSHDQEVQPSQPPERLKSTPEGTAVFDTRYRSGGLASAAIKGSAEHRLGSFPFYQPSTIISLR